MKTITDVIKLLGKERHNGIDDLTKSVFDKCNEFGIIKTKGKKQISIGIVNQIIRNILSQIKLGKGHWKAWSYRYGKDYFKLYDDPAVDIITVNKATLQSFEYVDAPEIKVRVNPAKEGVDAKPFFHVCATLSEAQEYVEKEEFATEIFLSVGRMIIPLDKGGEKQNI